MIRCFAAGVLALCAGCLKVDVKRCVNGAICPIDLACTETTDKVNHPVCGAPEEVSQCSGMFDRTACVRLNGDPGSCADNLCSDCDPNWVECRYQEWTPMASGTPGKLSSIAVFAPDDAFVAAVHEIRHYDGTSWEAVPGATSINSLTSVWGPSRTDLFAVDLNGNIFRGNNFITPDGTAGGVIYAISGSNSDDVTAVGLNRLIGHRSSTGWSPFVNSGLSSGAFEDVWTVGGTTYVVGTDFSGANVWIASGTNTTTIRDTSLPTSALLKAIWAPSVGDVFVAGKLANNAAIFHYSNGTWAQMTVDPPVSAQLRSLWGSSATDIYAVGDAATILHFDGNAWSIMPGPAGATADLVDVSGSGGDAFVVGANGTIWKRAR